MSKEPKNPSVSMERRSFFDSLRVRTTLLILLVVIPLAVGVVVFFGYRADRIFREEAEQRLEATAYTLDSNVSIWLNLNTKALTQMVSLPDIISLDAARQNPILKLTSAAFPHLFLVHTTDVNGVNITRNDDGENQNYSDRLWYQGAISGKPVQFQSLISRTTGKPALNMASPIRDASGAIIGVGSFVSELDDITREVNAQKVGDTGFAYIVDDTNRVVAHPDPAYTADLRDLSDYPPVAALRAGTRGLINFTDAEGTKWMAYVGEIDYGWGVIVQQPEREVLAKAGVFWQVTLLVASIAIVLLSILTWIITQRLTQPIASLTEAASAISAGQLEQRVKVERMDEVGLLGQAFNQMAEQVGGLLQTVQTRSVELEERTKELEASQRVTFAASEHATPDEMLDLVVNLIRDQFDLYHAQVYMVDEAQQAAVLRQSTGYAGRQLLQRKHHIALDATSLVTRAIHTGEAVLVDDVKADPNFLPNPLLPDTRSELVVPLKREGKVIGVLDAQDRTPGRFNPSTIALFQTMTDQVAILFENSELLQRVTDQTEVMGIFSNQLRTAADIARRLGTILDPEQLLQEVVELIQSRFGLYHAHIYLLDEEASVLKLATGSGEVGRVLRERGHSIPLDAEKSLVARAARARGAILVADTTLESDFMPNPLLPQTRSELSLPLVVGNTVLGVLDLQDDQAGRFTEAERDTFGTLAGLVATAIQNARLFEAQKQTDALIRRRAEFDRLVAEVSSAFVNATSVQIDEEIDHALEQISNFSNTDRSYVFIFSDDGTHMTNTHEWCAPGIAPQIQDLQNMPVTTLPWFTERITRPDQVVYLPRIADLPAEAAAEKQIFEEGAIRSLLAVPMIFAGSVAGFMGFDSVRQEREWGEEEITTLKSVGQTLISALQRRRAEDRIHIFQSLAENAADGITMVDFEGKIAYANRTAYEMLGFDFAQQEMLGMPMASLADESEQGRQAEAIRHIMTEGSSWTGEGQGQRKDGSQFDVAVTMFPVLNTTNQPISIAAILRDITERKAAEEAVRESRERFQGLVENLSDWIWEVNPNGAYTYISPRVKDLLGYTPEEMLGKTPFDFMPPEEAARVGQGFVELISVQAPLESLENVNIHKDGHLVVFETSGTPFYNTQGTFLGYRGTDRDITERKQAEESLRQANLVIESSPVILFRWRADEHWTVELVSDNIQQFGYTPEELLSGATPYATLVYPDDLERVANEVATFSASGVSSFQQEYRIVTKDGQIRWTDDRTTIIRDADGNITHYEGVVIDSTERKQAEAERERLSTVLSNSQDFIGIVDMAGNTIYVNPAGLQMCGYENLGAVLGKPIASFHIPEDAQRLAETVIPVVLETGASRVENRLLRTDGTLIPVDQTLFVIRDAQGNPQSLATFMTDITERKAAEGAIRESRQMLRTVMDSLPESIFWKDKDLVYLGCNTNFAQDAGFESPEQIIGKTDHDMPWKDQVALYQADDRHVIETGESKINYEEPQSTPDGGSIWLRTSKLPLYNEQGEAYAVLGAYADITEEKRAQAALQENEERLGLALQASEAGVWEFLPLAGQAYYDDRWFTMLGYDPHELPQSYTTWRNLLHPDDLATVEPFVNQKVQTGGDFSIEFRMKAKDGDWRWIHAIGKTVATNEDGVTTRMLGTHTDVTERVIREAEIEKRASELQTVAEVGTAAATILDPDRLLAQVVELTKSNFNLYHTHIYLIDETGESLVLAAGAGEAGAQMKAQGWKIAADSATSLVARAFRTREGVIVNDVRAAPDFLPNPLLPDTRAELAVPLIVGEQVLGVLDVQSDQVDRFTREDVAIQTTLAGQIATAIENARLFQESRQVDRLKSEFLANMSHELRTPLNSIIGYIQLLLMDLEGEVPEESFEDMQSIDTNSKHLLNLINDILDLAKIEAGRVELHLEEMDVAALLDTVKSNNAGLFIDSPLSFEVSAEEGLPRISADAVRINQILNNLISNAFKFTEAGGVTIRAYRDNNDVCIAVEDTGIGIAEKDLDTVFERFRQVDGSFSRRAEGTGLGLSITRLLVDMHKGKLTVRSKLGEGSTFTVHLPAVA